MVVRQEKRRVPRVPVSMQVGTPEGETVGFGYALNISVEGLAVDAQALASERSIPAEGSQLRLRFKLPKSNLVITVLGKVVRVERSNEAPRLAVEFLDATPDIRTEISRFVSSELSQPTKHR
jgi:hypothetical protein